MQDMSKIAAPTWMTAPSTVSMAKAADKWLGPSLTAVGHVIEGGQAQADAKFVSRQLQQNAKATRASASFQAADLRRQQLLLESRARAVAASSGGSASDVNVVNAISDIAREGETRALTALYNGNERAIGMELKAKTVEASGRSKSMAKKFAAATTMLNPGFDRYRNARELLTGKL